MIHLTKEEVAAAKSVGMDLRVYARAKADMLRREEEHKEWLQTPAGVEYMRAEIKRLEEDKKNFPKAE